MALSEAGVRWRETGREKLERSFRGMGETARQAADKIKSSGIATAEVGKKSEIAADGIKDFADSMARGDGVAMALMNTISPLSSGLFALGTTLSMGLAAVIPFVVMGLANLADEGKSTKEVTDELKASTEALIQAHNDSKQTLLELLPQYGAYSDEMQKLHGLMLLVAQSDALEKSNEAVAKLFSITPIDTIDWLMSVIHGVEMTQTSLDDLQEKWGFTADAAADYVRVQKELENTKDLVERGKLAQELLDIMTAQNKSAQDFNAQEKEAIGLLGQVVAQGRAAEAAMGGVATGAAGAGSNISAAAGNAWNLAAALNAAAAALGQMQSARANAQVNLGRENRRAAAIAAGEDPNAAAAKYDAELTAANGVRDSGGSAAVQREGQRLIEAVTAAEAQAKANEEALKKLFSGGGGGKGGGAGGGKSATAKQTDEQKELAKGLKEVEGNVDDTKAAYLEWYDGMSEGMSSTSDLMTTAFNGMEDAFVEFVKTGKVDFSSLVDSMISDLARYAFRAATMQAMTSFLPNLFGSSSAVLESAGPLARPTSMAFNGAIVNHPTKFFANGGLASMSEKSAEAIMPLTRNSRGQLGVYSDGGSGGGYVINLSPTINIEGSGDSQADMMKGAKEFNKLIENKVVDVMAKQGRSRLYRG